MTASEIATIRPAQESDTAALAALWDDAFDGRLSPAQWLVDRKRFAHTMVAVDEAGMCGSIWGLPKRLRETGGAAALVHCIGSVAVAPRARGRGLARRLLAASMAASGDADWALLFTGTPEVYSSSGFESFHMRRTLSGPWAPGAIAGGPLDVVRSVVGAGAFDRVRHVYEGSRAGLTLAPVRDSVDWAMAEVRLAGSPIYTVRIGGQLLGYAVARTFRRDGAVQGSIEEAAVTPGEDGEHEVWHALLAAIAADWTAAGVTTCELTAPDAAERSAQHQAIRVFAPGAEHTPDHTGMARALRREPRLEGIRHFTAADYF